MVMDWISGWIVGGSRFTNTCCGEGAVPLEIFALSCTGRGLQRELHYTVQNIFVIFVEFEANLVSMLLSCTCLLTSVLAFRGYYDCCLGLYFGS